MISNRRNIDKEILRIKNILKKYAFSQGRRFFLQGDPQSNAEDIYSHVYMKFFARFMEEEHQEEFTEIIESNKLERYLKVSIRNRASDIKDLQNHAPTDLRANPSKNQEGEDVDPLDTIGDDRPNPERDLYFRKIIDLLKEDLDEVEAELIYYKFEKNMTFDEISKILRINSNTLRTKLNQIRLKHSKYKNLTMEDNE